VFVGPNGTQDVFEAGKGDVIFAPEGHYHYFENASATEELVALIVFNSDAAEPKDDIGIGQSLTAIPNDVAVSGVETCPSQSSNRFALFPAASSS
jgi:oxalate decarboxylase